MKPPLSYLPALPCAIGFMIGIADASHEIGLWIFGAGIISFLMLYLLHQHYLAIIPLFAVIGAITSVANAPLVVDKNCIGKESELTVTILSEQESNYGISCVCRIDSINQRSSGAKCLLRLPPTVNFATIGAKLQFHGTLRHLPPKDPVPFSFDYSHYLQLQGISATITLYDGDIISLVSPPDLFNSYADGLRNAIFYNIANSPIDGHTAAFLIASILGNDYYIDSTTYEQFRSTGIAHILALSGLHVGIIASLLSVLFLPIQVIRKGYIYKNIATIAIIWLYTIIVGLGPSVVRASTMVSVFLCANLIQRNSYPLNSLCIAAIVVLALNPASLFTPGFQMSFCAVLSIILAMPLIPNKLRRIPWKYNLLCFLLLPCIAMVGTGIIAAYHFHSFSLVFLLSNMLVGLIFPCLLIGGILLLTLTAIGLHVLWLGTFLDTFYGVLEWWTSFLSIYPYHSIFGIFISGYSIPIYFLTLLLLIMAIRAAFTSEERFKRPNYSLWVWTVVAFVGFLLVNGLANPLPPKEEAYLPSTIPGCIITSSPDAAILIPYEEKTTEKEASEIYDKRYATFLAHRGKDRFLYADQMQGKPFTVGGRTLMTFNQIITPTQKREKIHYAIIGSEYSGTISDILECCDPDTIVTSPSMHPSRRNKLAKECNGTKPMINIKEAPLGWTKK